MPDETSLSESHQTASNIPVAYQQPIHEDLKSRRAAPSTTPVQASEPREPYHAPQVLTNHPSLEVRPFRTFEFDGGAGSYFGVGILAALLTVFTLGFATPWATCMLYRWKTEHTVIQGRRLRFTGRGAELFGMWIVWFLLMIVTLGIYSFWVQPRVTKWCVEHQEF